MGSQQCRSWRRCIGRGNPAFRQAAMNGCEQSHLIPGQPQPQKHTEEITIVGGERKRVNRLLPGALRPFLYTDSCPCGILAGETAALVAARTVVATGFAGTVVLHRRPSVCGGFMGGKIYLRDPIKQTRAGARQKTREHKNYRYFLQNQPVHFFYFVQKSLRQRRKR